MYKPMQQTAGYEKIKIMNATVNSKNFQSRWSEIIDPPLATEDASFNFLVPKTVTYYRSKAFVSQIGINPLIAASAPLFFLIEKIQALSSAPDIEKLHDDLIHEVNAFEHQAGASGYRSYVILAARYVLCLWIDQTILSAPWGENSEWEKIRLTDAQETEKSSPFYLLLNRCLQEPTVYVDLLELFYLCLSLGFVGNSTPLESNSTKIAETREYLFETISRQREGCSKRLEIDTLVKDTHKRFSLRPLLRPGIAIFAIVILITTYCTLNTNLEAPMRGADTPLASN